MNKIKVYSRETILNYVHSDPANKCRPLYKYGMCKHYVVEKAGYQTAVFTYKTSIDGEQYYTLRRWNATPKKYAVGGGVLITPRIFSSHAEKRRGRVQAPPVAIGYKSPLHVENRKAV